MTLALGTMTWGRESTEDEARRMYSLARERGVRWFDSASSYSDGEAERILGRCLAADPRRDEVLISTKGGYRGEDILQEIEGSAQRLGVDVIQLYLHHHWARHGSCNALAAMLGSPNVRFVGLSNCTAWQVAQEHADVVRYGQGEISAIQILYNLAKRGAESELIPWAQHAGVKVFAYSPLAAGLLTGKYRLSRRGPTLWRLNADERYRRRFAAAMVPNSDGEYLPWRYMATAGELGMTAAQLAVAWCEAHPSGLVIPVVGTRYMSQLEELLCRKEISAEQWRAVASLFPAPQHPTGRPDDDEVMP